MNNSEKIALEYVRNTHGGATKLHFVEDHEPVGLFLWDRLERAGFIHQIDGHVYCTPHGLDALQKG